MKPTAERFGGSKEKKIFVNEHLTKATAELKKYAREKLGPMEFIVDTRDCKVMVWKRDGRKMKILSREQIDEISRTALMA